MAEADASLARLHHRVAERARLRGDPDRAEMVRHPIEARNEERAGPRQVVDDAEAVGADDPHVGGRADRGQPVLLDLALGKTGLGITRGEDDDAADAARRAILDGRLDALARQRR